MVVIPIGRRRSPLRQWLGRAVIALLFASAWLLSHSHQLAAALGIAVVLIWWEFWPAPGKLRPFRVRVHPNWSKILVDHHVMPSEQVASALARIASAESQASYSPLTRGIGFTVLELELGYHDDRHSFFTEVDIEEPIPDWTQPLPQTRVDVKVAPTLYVGWTLDPLPGYELGITTPTSKLKSYLPGDKGDRIKLATLPSLALAEHWDTVNDILDKRRQAEKEAAMAQCGWRRVGVEDEDTLEAEPKCLEHKYFTVYHVSI